MSSHEDDDDGEGRNHYSTSRSNDSSKTSKKKGAKRVVNSAAGKGKLKRNDRKFQAKQQAAQNGDVSGDSEVEVKGEPSDVAPSSSTVLSRKQRKAQESQARLQEIKQAQEQEVKDQEDLDLFLKTEVFKGLAIDSEDEIAEQFRHNSDDERDPEDELYGEDYFGRGAGGSGEAPMTARRFHSSYGNLGDDSDDSSDDENIVNTVGNIPLEWYDDYDHVGYDRTGQPIMRKIEKKDTIDQFLENADNPNFWRTIHDKLNDREVVLSDSDMKMIRNIQRRRFPSGYNPYTETVEYDRPEDKIHPLNNNLPSKSSFTGVKRWEEKKVVGHLRRFLKRGWISQTIEKEEKPKYYDVWALPTDERAYIPKGRVRYPRARKPGHEESYRPPREYVMDKQELEKWKKYDERDRPYLGFVPQLHDNMRSIGGYKDLPKELYARALKMYLCPRKMKIKKRKYQGVWDKESLVPKLPKPRDLRPFPSTEGVVYTGHRGRVRTISVDPTGQYFCSGGDDGTLRVWEISTSRCIAKWNLAGVIHSVAWNPNSELSVIAVAVDDWVVLITPDIYLKGSVTNMLLSVLDRRRPLNTDIKKRSGEDYTKLNMQRFIMWEYARRSKAEDDAEAAMQAETPAAATTGGDFMDTSGAMDEDDEATDSTSKNAKDGANGSADGEGAADDGLARDDAGEVIVDAVSDEVKYTSMGKEQGIAIIIRHFKTVKHVSWHAKGDYFSTTTPTGDSKTIHIHRLTHRTSHCPFKKSLGQVQSAIFHPTKTHFIVALKQSVRTYDLLEQKVVNRLTPIGIKWISSIDIHPKGDNIIVGSYDKRLAWFDTQLSDRPYKTMRLHSWAVRGVVFHKHFPLFASCSDDLKIHVYHGMVYDDWNQNALIVPLKVLQGHTAYDDLGVLDLVFHPIQPWLFSAGADGTVRLWV